MCRHDLDFYQCCLEFGDYLKAEKRSQLKNAEMNAKKKSKKEKKPSNSTANEASTVESEIKNVISPHQPTQISTAKRTRPGTADSQKSKSPFNAFLQQITSSLPQTPIRPSSSKKIRKLSAREQLKEIEAEIVEKMNQMRKLRDSVELESG
jgi:uncharacterized protein YkwD